MTVSSGARACPGFVIPASFRSSSVMSLRADHTTPALGDANRGRSLLSFGGVVCVCVCVCVWGAHRVTIRGD